MSTETQPSSGAAICCYGIPAGDVAAPGWRTFLADGTAQITWWGSRYVTLEGTEKTMSLSELAKNVLSNAHLQDSDPIGGAERELQAHAIRRISTLYEQSDKLIHSACWIAQLIFKIIEWFGANGVNAKATLEGSASDRLRAFTREEYEKEFPDTSLTDEIHFPGIKEPLYFAPPKVQ